MMIIFHHTYTRNRKDKILIAFDTVCAQRKENERHFTNNFMQCPSYLLIRLIVPDCPKKVQRLVCITLFLSC
jgi:hypothetical protein